MYLEAIAWAAAFLLHLAMAAPAEHLASIVHKRATPVEKDSTLCSGVYVIYAAGTQFQTYTPSPYPTPVNTILPAIASSAIPSATAVSLPYPASFSKYGLSWYDGTMAMQAMIKEYIDDHPGCPLVLMGMSQGSSVVTAAIGGYYQTGLPEIPPLADNYTKHISGGVVFADPSFQIGVSPLDWTKKTSSTDPNTTKNGSFPNGDSQSITTTKVKTLRSFCETGDEFCANARPLGGAIHVQEQSYWGPTAIAYLKSLNICV